MDRKLVGLIGLGSRHCCRMMSSRDFRRLHSRIRGRYWQFRQVFSELGSSSLWRNRCAGSRPFETPWRYDSRWLLTRERFSRSVGKFRWCLPSLVRRAPLSPSTALEKRGPGIGLYAWFRVSLASFCARKNVRRFFSMYSCWLRETCALYRYLLWGSGRRYYG